MKFLTFMLVYFSLSLAKAQLYNVEIKIEGVVDLATAKPITDPIRYKYNQFPVFNDTTDQFEFAAIYNFTEAEIAALLAEYGYTLVHYISVEEREEEDSEFVNE